MLPLSKIQHQLVNLHNSIRGERVIRMNLQEYLELEDGNYFETTKHYVCQCPYCIETFGYEKNKLYIEKDSVEFGFCQRCKSIYVNYTTDLDFEVISKKEVNKSFTLLKLPQNSSNIGGHDYSLNSYNKCIKDDDGILNLLKLRNIEKFTNLGDSVKMKRNEERYRPLIAKLGLKGGKVDDNHGFIMVPFYIGGQLVYWQSKLIGYNIKYYMPPIQHKPLYIPEFRSKDIIIVEGIFDAMACLYLFPNLTPISILGSYATDYHVWLLRNYIQPTSCTIALDNIKLSLNVLFQLRGLIPTITRFSLFQSKFDQDPDEFLLSMSDEELEEFKSTHNYANNKFEWE